MKQQFYLFLICFICSFSAIAQDKIYLENGIKEGRVFEIGTDKIKYSNPLNPGPVYSLSRSKVMFLFGHNGKFLVVSKMEPGSIAATDLTGRYLADTFTSKATQDIIFTVQKKKLAANIIKEDSHTVSIDLNGVEVNMDKSAIALILYKNGTHELIAPVADVADVLWTFQDSGVASAPALTEAPKKEKPKVTASDKVPVKKPVILAVPEAVAAPVPAPATAPTILPTTASLVLNAGKSPQVKYLLNDSLTGILKLNSNKKIMLAAGMYKIHMDDGQDNLYDKTITITDSSFGKEIKVSFPDINYALQKELKRKEMLEKYLAQEQTVSADFQLCKNQKNELIKDSLSVVTGQKNLDDTSDTLMLHFRDGYQEFTEALKSLQGSFTKSDFKVNESDFEKTLNTEGLKNLNSTYIYLLALKNHTKPESNSLQVAIRNNRTADFKFFVADSNYADIKTEGVSILVYALNNNCKVSTIDFIIKKMGKENINTFPKSNVPGIYESPLKIASLTGNMENISLLLDNGASLYPTSATRKERTAQCAYLQTHCSNKTALIELFNRKGIPMADYELEAKKAVDSILAHMVWVEGGKYTIGCLSDPKDQCVNSERPATEITLSSFYLNQFEVTRKEWNQIMGEDDPGMFRDCENCPVERISFDTAVAFIRRLNKLTHLQFRLPSEAEWEYACSGGRKATTRYQFSGSDNYNEVAWTKENSLEKTHPVGTKKPNDLGLYDMSGNVLEWCNDYFSEGYYQQIPAANPTGPESGSRRCVRGGSWYQPSWNSRLTRRDGQSPGFMNEAIGFRLALTNKE